MRIFDLWSLDRWSFTVHTCLLYNLFVWLFSGVYCCLFDHKQIISGGGDGYVMVWDTPTGEHKLTLSGHKEEVVCLHT